MMIREVSKSDGGKIFEFLQDGIGSEYLDQVTQEFMDAISGRLYGFVAANGDNILGYITCQRDVQTYRIGTIAVRSSSRGKGIGTTLINHLIDYLNREGADVNTLNVVTDADAGDNIRFYSRCGFKISGYVNDEFIPGIGQVHLTRTLR